MSPLGCRSRVNRTGVPAGAGDEMVGAGGPGGTGHHLEAKEPPGLCGRDLVVAVDGPPARPGEVCR
jgi:hypothetical protein